MNNRNSRTPQPQSAGHSTVQQSASVRATEMSTANASRTSCWCCGVVVHKTVGDSWSRGATAGWRAHGVLQTATHAHMHACTCSHITVRTPSPSLCVRLLISTGRTTNAGSTATDKSQRTATRMDHPTDFQWSCEVLLTTIPLPRGTYT